MNLNGKLLVTVALILAVLALFAYIPVPVTREEFTESSTLPCRTVTVLVPSGTLVTYTLSLCTCTVIQSQSYASRYVPTVTCPVTVYTSTRVVELPLALGRPWLPILLLALMGGCLAGGAYAMRRRGGKT